MCVCVCVGINAYRVVVLLVAQLGLEVLVHLLIKVSSIVGFSIVSLMYVVGCEKNDEFEN